MRLNRDLLGWGVFFITLGAVPLAVRGGLIGEDTVRRAWELWPLILVGIGLGLILRRTQAALVGGLVIALTFGLMAGSFVAVGAGVPFVGCGGSDTSGSAFTPQSGTLGGSASVKLALNCGELNVTPGAGSGWALSGSDEGGKGPKVSAGTGRLTIESEEFKGFGLRARDRWDVALPVDPSLSLEVSVNAGSGRLDLNGMHVPSISLSVNAGDGRIDMGNAAAVGSLSASANAGSISLTLPAASLSGSVTANAGSIELCVPDGVALTIRMSDNLLGSNNFGNRGLTRSGDSWTRTGSGSAAIDLSASANAGSITLNPEDGCDR